MKRITLTAIVMALMILGIACHKRSDQGRENLPENGFHLQGVLRGPG